MHPLLRRAAVLLPFLFSLLTPMAAAADDVTIQLGAGAGLSVKDSTATERVRIDETGGLKLGQADLDQLCSDAARGTMRFFPRPSGDALAVCARTGKGDFVWKQLGGSSCSFVDEDTPQVSTIGAVGATGSDYYAQSFLADVHRITQVGVYLYENAAGGQIRLAIVPDSGGNPDVANPVWESLMIDPSNTSGWVYVDGVDADVTPGSRYYLVVDGYNNPGATGYDNVGTSPGYFTDTGDDFVYSNSGGASWSTFSAPLSIHVQGCSEEAHVAKTYGSVCLIGPGLNYTSKCVGSFSHLAREGEVAVVWGSLGVATSSATYNASVVYYSTDGGSTWLPCGSQYFNDSTGEAATLNNATASSCTMPLTAGQTYRFSLGFNGGLTVGTSHGTITAVVLPKH